MAKKPHGLLLLFEGLPATVIQSQVLARVKWIESQDIATFDILSFAHSKILYRTSADALAKLPADLRGKIKLARSIRPALPRSRELNRVRLKQYLGVSCDYDFLQARGDYAAAVAGPIAQSLDRPMIWDCRGDAEAEFLERLGPEGKINPLVKWRARGLREDAHLAARTAAAASFVSQPLRKKWLAALGTVPAHVIPCLADESLFFFDTNLREAMRRRLGYTASDTVIVFSGSLNVYQGFELLVSWFQRKSADMPSLRLLVVTPKVDQATSLLSSLTPSRITVTSAPFPEVNGYLNAADYAFMVRPESLTNQSAFPTKFAEYGLAGLPAIVGPAVPDCYEFAREAGNLVLFDEIAKEFLRPQADRNVIMSRYAAGLTHAGRHSDIRGLYKHIARQG